MTPGYVDASSAKFGACFPYALDSDELWRICWPLPNEVVGWAQMELQGLRVKNLRCLTDTGRVPIRPITVLVGRNSSGKSSFLRAFPLLRQSVQTATESPILWYDQGLVDFGTFGTAINHRAEDRTITFEFSVKVATRWGTAGAAWLHVAMELGEGIPPHGSYVAGYRIECLDYIAVLRFSPEGRLIHFDVNGQDIFAVDESICLDGYARLFPRMGYADSGKVEYTTGTGRTARGRAGGSAARRQPGWSLPFQDKLFDLLRPVYYGKTSDETIRELVRRWPLIPAQHVWAYLQERRPTKKAFNNSESAEVKQLAEQVARYGFAGNLQELIGGVDFEVADFMSRVQYLRPLRATADRSYRIQDLAVTDVDPDGKNLAMFMYSLSAEERESFVSFTREHLGFESKIELSGLNAEILVKEPNADRHINLVDIGFGYTEVLPLMAILWSTCCRTPDSASQPTSLLAIEQPELHLHPAHQVKLAHVIAGAWKASRDAKREVKIMVETHSEGIVNGLGDLIEKKVLREDDVQLVIFDQDPETRQTQVRLAGYTDDGALNDDWPFGFFAPVAD